jgi:hypothetical protein
MKNSKVISQLTDEEKQALRLFANPTEAINAYHMDQIAMHDLIRVRYTHHDGTTERLVTTPGRLLFNEIVPPELGFVNQPVDKKGLTGSSCAATPKSAPSVACSSWTRSRRWASSTARSRASRFRWPMSR